MPFPCGLSRLAQWPSHNSLFHMAAFCFLEPENTPLPPSRVPMGGVYDQTSVTAHIPVALASVTVARKKIKGIFSTCWWWHGRDTWISELVSLGYIVPQYSSQFHNSQDYTERLHRDGGGNLFLFILFFYPMPGMKPRGKTPEHKEQGLADYHLVPFVFINKALLEHTHPDLLILVREWQSSVNCDHVDSKA